MSKYQDLTELTELTLGQKTDYCEHYSPSLLQSVPRSLGRNQLNLSDPLPFSGFDLWTLYELSWLNEKGLPQVAIGEMRLAASSINLIESKSFKLYLNSLNQTHFKSWQHVATTLEKDLSACAMGHVSIKLFALDKLTQLPIAALSGKNIDAQDIEIDHYQTDPNLLQNAAQGPIVSETLNSNLLKSNCLITQQPDWGSLQISYTGKQINQEKLLRYIISFRRHNEFHEQCVERIFSDIINYCQPQNLTVYARYTRRGGLDINPYRSNIDQAPDNNHRLARQ